MARVINGKEVAATIEADLQARSSALRNIGVTPTLALLRVGQRDEAIAYEQNATKHTSNCGVDIMHAILPESCSQVQLEDTLAMLCGNPKIHGVIVMSPLPEHLDLMSLAEKMDTEKDIEGITPRSVARTFASLDEGFPPCTAEACIKILEHYGIDPDGKHIVIIGRSAVVGRPVSALLIERSATVTVCHTHTVDISKITRQADILIVAAGKPKLITAEHVSPGQIIIDVGTTWDEEQQRIFGDVAFDEVEPIVDMISPVPGGVGSVTASVLVSHVIEAAEKRVARKYGGVIPSADQLHQEN